MIDDNFNFFNYQMITINSTEAATIATTATATSTLSKPQITPLQFRMNALVTLLFSIVVIFGNGAVILVFVFDKTIRTINNKAVTLLAMTDFLRGTLVMLPKVVTHLTVSYSLPEPICGITAVFSAFTFFFHPMVLAMIACIRYFVIVPWSRRAKYMTVTRLRIIFGIVFSSAVVFSILPYLGVGEYKFSPYHGVCFANWEPVNRVFRSIFYVFVIGVAFPVLTFSYTKLFLMLRKHNKAMRRHVVKSHPKDLATRNIVAIEKGVSLTRVKRRSHSAIYYEEFVKHKDRLSTDDPGKNVEQSAELKLFESLDIESLKIKHKERISIYSDNLGRHQNSSTISLDVDICTVDQLIQTRSKIKVNSSATESVEDAARITFSENRKSKVKLSFGRIHLSKQEYQMTKLMILIFLAYVVCWFPAAIVNVVALIDTKHVPEIWFAVIVTMVELKSCLNPLIYGIGNQMYRDKIKTFFKKHLPSVCK
ncbi:D(2) dopamine receptor A-like [Clytia hemisphaerica]|uniref:G-protein coupled receptors family 1 profile domain-containing protein n=1 Tax=Clytia hemisphaerica TaxID=252671 RepID=A0A7M5VAN0_9CNID